ncbi:MAG: hypothetical protein ABJB76_03850 [Candidatus Nitrosocosmicus sp.]
MPFKKVKTSGYLNLCYDNLTSNNIFLLPSSLSPITTTIYDFFNGFIHAEIISNGGKKA